MPYTTDADLEARLAGRLDPLEFGLGWNDPPPASGDYDLNPNARPAEMPILKPAAVLVPIIRRREGYTIVLTERAAHLQRHAGQVAFPGGRIDAEDDGPVGAALREAEEEVGLAPRYVRPIGAMPPYETVTGFTVAPIVALVEPAAQFSPDPREVADIFELPCAIAFSPSSHVRRTAVFRGAPRAYWTVTFEGRNIWGATAGMIIALYSRLYLGERLSC